MSAQKSVWLAIGCILAVLYLAGCGSNDNQPVKTITNTVTNFQAIYITNTIINIVTNEVVKEVPVPAEIPQIYLDAFRVYNLMSNATQVAYDQALFSMDDIKVNYHIDDEISQTIILDEVKARFELALRKNGIIINPDSKNRLNVIINGFLDQSKALMCWSIKYEVFENQFVCRNGVWHMENVAVWNKSGKYGTVGVLKANDGILDNVEKGAEIFANDFLTANPKK